MEVGMDPTYWQKWETFEWWANKWFRLFLRVFVIMVRTMVRTSTLMQIHKTAYLDDLRHLYENTYE